jgi:NAD(P)-dependent dehydrogenase (short-subunit alcohol dehydrogenase family)
MKNKTALVTGAGSGIGRATALAFAREGARVIVADIDDASGHKTVDLIAATGGTGVFQRLDVTDPSQHLEAVASARRQFGALHIAVNNAGISVGRSGSYRPLADVDIGDWDDVIGVNLGGVFHGLKAQIPALLEAGGGAIVNIASIMGQVARAGIAPYVASKHGVVGLTRAAALDYAAQGVRVNAVGPGYIETPMLANKDESTLKLLAGQHPMGRLGRPQEIAELVVWLCSQRASFVTGAYYPVDGGFLAQ